MVTTDEHNKLIGKFNKLLEQKNILEGQIQPRKEIERGENIILDGISISSNILPVDELIGLLKMMLEDKTIKDYLDFKKKAKQKDIMSGIG